MPTPIWRPRHGPRVPYCARAVFTTAVLLSTLSLLYHQTPELYRHFNVTIVSRGEWNETKTVTRSASAVKSASTEKHATRTVPEATAQAAAVCFHGEFRSLLHTVSTLRRHIIRPLIASFKTVDVFAVTVRHASSTQNFTLEMSRLGPLTDSEVQLPTAACLPQGDP